MMGVTGYRDSRGCSYGGDYFHPYLLDSEDWEEKEKEIIECLDIGMPPMHAFKYVGIHRVTYWKWNKRFEEDLKKGVYDSPFMKFMFKMMRHSELLHKELLEKAKEIALSGEGHAKTIQYLLDTRYKYSKKQEVEISTEEDTQFNINIVESKPRED